MKRTTMTALALASLALVAMTSGCLEPFCPYGEEPIAHIDKPPLRSADVQQYGEVVAFEWHVDPECRPMSTRYLCIIVPDTFIAPTPPFDPSGIINDLNENLERYEEDWSDWVEYNARNDAGRRVTISFLDGDGVIGDNEIANLGKLHLFAVQARSYCYHVTTTFELNGNTRLFIPTNIAGPLLTIREPFLGCSKFIGTGMDPVSYDLAPGVPLNFN